MKLYDTEKDLSEIKRLEQAAGEKIRRSKYALAFHLMPPAGWLNDPNGLCQKDGIYHIFFQYAPHEADGSSLKYWGHYQTCDFVHYTYTGILLSPDEELDRSGVYSGSAYVEGDTMYLYYTGNVLEAGDYDYTTAGRQANTVLVTTKDGISASEKECLLRQADYPAKLSCHVRDPKVWKENGVYYMVLGARTLQDEGCVMIYTAEDQRHFSFSQFIRPDAPFGYMWECPDIFMLDGRRFLSVSPQGVPSEKLRYQNVYQSGYFPLQAIGGRSDGEAADDGQAAAGRGITEFSDVSPETFSEWDMGFDFYAPQTFSDEAGRRILIGWIGNPDAPYENPTVGDGWQHTLTLPRRLALTMDGKHILQNPVEEIINLRESSPVVYRDTDQFSAPILCELLIDKFPDGDFLLTIDGSIRISYQNAAQLLSLSFAEEETGETICRGYGRTVRNARLDAPLKNLRLFLDTSCLELYVNDGACVMTSRFYKSGGDGYLFQITKGCEATVYSLKPMHFTSV